MKIIVTMVQIIDEWLMITDGHYHKEQYHLHSVFMVEQIMSMFHHQQHRYCKDTDNG